MDLVICLFDDGVDPGVDLGGVGNLDGSDWFGSVGGGDVGSLCSKNAVVLALKLGARNSQLLFLPLLQVFQSLLLLGLLAEEVVMNMRTACGFACLASKAVVPQWAALFGDLIVRHLADDVGCRSEVTKVDA